MGGVINIITKTPEKLELMATAGYGTNDTRKYAFIAGNRFTDKLSLHEHDYGPLHTFIGTFGDLTSYADAGTNQRARFRPNDFIGYTGIGENDDQSYTLSVDQRIGATEFHFQAGATTGEDRYTLESSSGLADYSDSAGTLSETDKEGWFSELRISMPLGQSHLLTLGVSYRTDKSYTNQYTVAFYRSYSDITGHSYYAGGKDRIWGIFIQEEWQAAQPVAVYFSGRYDTWKVYDGASGTPGVLTSYDENSDSAFSSLTARTNR